ncbi:hypothetical protein BU24DRAFT_427468 [Aaosphaeria arxii CBS 175.79]|uniref:Uncharacterized protein n=1 Tax=Aaosphaeria arxii CBS 175.79 TaxID=1450172 RepID=A0A6A5XBR7_9PLEO|nr:uncharacterized protein BU24DRAFT_427468 [Aaosphaeria arxii CBS 175.79]KAF2010339.1 hypothetical protein BU24DRAFT_427468 [Aaosphaeria arxii CBS 175.79]
MPKPNPYPEPYRQTRRPSAIQHYFSYRAVPPSNPGLPGGASQNERGTYYRQTDSCCRRGEKDSTYTVAERGNEG